MRTCLLFVSAALLVTTAASASSFSFTGLGGLAGENSPFGVDSRAFGVSADGSTVVGTTRSGSTVQAFRWTQSGGMVSLCADCAQSDAFNVSADGSVVVGRKITSVSENFRDDVSEPFRWTQSGGMVGLGGTSGASGDGAPAYGVSADGSVVVGRARVDNRVQAFRWTESDGMIGLDDLGLNVSFAYDVSADGSVVVGEGFHGLANGAAFRWTQSSGMVGLGSLTTAPEGAPPAYAYSYARAVSDDGSVVVGHSNTALSSAYEAFIWTENDGMIGLGDLPGSPLVASYAFDVSGDGSVVVGNGNDPNDGTTAFIWDETHGMRSLSQILTDGGIDLTGWDLKNAEAVSFDGSTIVGWGTNPSGKRDAWIATIPEPNTALLLSLGLTGLAAKRRRSLRS